jgi:hypothetical protein
MTTEVAEPSSRVVKGTGLGLLAYWDCVQFPLGAWGCVCCQVEVSVMSWSLIQRSPTDWCNPCNLETSWMRRPSLLRVVGKKQTPTINIALRLTIQVTPVMAHVWTFYHKCMCHVDNIWWHTSCIGVEWWHTLYYWGGIMHTLYYWVERWHTLYYWGRTVAHLVLLGWNGGTLVLLGCNDGTLLVLLAWNGGIPNSNFVSPYNPITGHPGPRRGVQVQLTHSRPRR